MRLASLLIALAATAGVACQPSDSPPQARPPTIPPPPSPVLPAEAQRSLEPAPMVASCGTPVIDGVMSPGEWDSAVKVRFGANLPESLGGGTVPAEIMTMSDDRNLYVAYRYQYDTTRFAQSHEVELDANGSGAPDAGDDRWLVNWNPQVMGVDTVDFFDGFRGPCLMNGQVVEDCAPEDIDPDTGFGVPGTKDGGASIRAEGGFTFVEMWHPFHGGDARDVAATQGDGLPLAFFIRLLDTCGDWPRCFGDTYFPELQPGQPSRYRPFQLACGAPPPPPGGDDDEDVIEVRIDVKPGDPLPTIQLGTGGVTTVAVLGSGSFLVASVDPSSLWFAGAPVALNPGGTPRVSAADVNDDRIDDLVATFETSALHLQPGDVEASLAGRTVAGRRFHGTDAVRVVQ